MKTDNCLAKKITPQTLMILPCCSEKKDGGLGNYEEYLSKYISRDCYKRIIETRKKILSNLKQNDEYITGKYRKNKNIKAGKDFGEANSTGKYMQAIDRYAGSLYSAVPDFPRLVRQSLKKGNGPKIIILSALYGPLHPLDMIQDYNLKMSDKPAYTAWKTTFCSFLPEFVVDNEMKHILVYLGKQTAYFKVAESAIRKLNDVPTINAIHFNVKNGTSYLTPHNHGLCIAKHLGYSEEISFTRKIEEQPFV
jgi:cytoplasmic iron level regulating protein YaaA (DUF328/UPF0246 family)